MTAEERRRFDDLASRARILREALAARPMWPGRLWRRLRAELDTVEGALDAECARHTRAGTFDDPSPPADPFAEFDSPAAFAKPRQSPRPRRQCRPIGNREYRAPVPAAAESVRRRLTAEECSSRSTDLGVALPLMWSWAPYVGFSDMITIPLGCRSRRGEFQINAWRMRDYVGDEND